MSDKIKAVVARKFGPDVAGMIVNFIIDLTILDGKAEHGAKFDYAINRITSIGRHLNRYNWFTNIPSFHTCRDPAFAEIMLDGALCDNGTGADYRFSIVQVRGGRGRLCLDYQNFKRVWEDGPRP